MLLLHLFQTVALAGATVHTQVEGSEPRVATVLIEGRRIARVEAADAIELPEDCEVIDVTGLHLIPGLIDARINYDPEHDALYVAAGVTCVRDTGSMLTRVIAEREPAARARTPGPDLIVAGPILDGFPPITDDAAVLRTAEEASLKLPPLLAAGVDFLSFYQGLPEPAWRKAIELGHAAGVEVWGPVPRGLHLADVVQAGQDGVFSLEGLLPEGKRWHEVDAKDVQAALEVLKGSKLEITPLLHVFGRMLVERAEDPPELALLGPEYDVAWRAELERWRRELSPALRASAQEALDRQRATLRRMHDAGIRLVPGSGAPNAWLMPGESLIAELEEWAQAGIPAEEVLRAATADAALALGFHSGRGTLEAGKIADLVALASDPRLSVQALSDPELVVVRGQVLEREDLAERVARVTALQAERREELTAPLEVEPPELPEGELVLSGRAEARAFGLRVHAEAFAIVRLPDGKLAYCTRLVTPESATESGSEMHLIQRVRPDGLLESFELRADGGDHVITVQGLLLGGLMNIEQRVDGNFLANRRARESISLVDIGSVTSEILLAYHAKPGFSHVLTFEGVEPIVDRWRLELTPADGRLRIGTGDGWRVCGLLETGAPAFAIHQTGHAQTDLQFRDVERHGDDPLALEGARVFRPPTGKGDPVDASSPEEESR